MCTNSSQPSSTSWAPAATYAKRCSEETSRGFSGIGNRSQVSSLKFEVSSGDLNLEHLRTLDLRLETFAISVSHRPEMLAQQVSPEIAVEIAPHRVDVVAVVLR